MDDFLKRHKTKKNEILDYILLELYKKELAINNMQAWHSVNDILDVKYPMNESRKQYYVEILFRDGYICRSFRGDHIEELLLINYGKHFCETSSYSQPDTPIINKL